MENVMKIIGIILLTLGVWFFIVPKMTIKITSVVMKGKRLYFAAAFRVILGIIYLLAANDCRHSWIIKILGIIILLSGIIVFALGLEKCRETLQWYQNRPAWAYRLPSIVIFAIGCLTIYAA